MPGRLRELKGNRKLIFLPNHKPMPSTEDGGLDWSRVTAVKILGIEDTQE